MVFYGINGISWCFFLFYGDLMGILPTRMWILILDNDL